MLSIHDILADVSEAYTDLRDAYRPALAEADTAIARFGIARAMGREARATLKVAQSEAPKAEAPKAEAPKAEAPKPVRRSAKAKASEPVKG